MRIQSGQQALFEPSRTPNLQEGSVPRAIARRRILVVEDDFVQADRICDAVRAMGLAAIGPVASLEGAVALATSENLDGALLDVCLQRGLRVYPVAEILRRRQIRFCFITGHSETEVTELSAEAVFHKPVSLGALSSAINLLIDDQ